MRSDSVGGYSDVTIEDYRRILFGSKHCFSQWLRNRGTPLSSYFYNQGYPEQSSWGDKSLGALVPETWTEYLANTTIQASMVSMQCCAILTLLKFIRIFARNSQCNDAEFLVSRSNYFERLDLVILCTNGTQLMLNWTFLTLCWPTVA